MSPVQIPVTPPQETVESTREQKHAHAAQVHGFATRALHVGSEPESSAYGAVVPGIELSTTYQQSSVGVHKGFEYTRSDNPTRQALERQLSSLEGGKAIAFSSGSAATATVVSGLAGHGGHLISVGDVYGGTSRYMLQVAAVHQNVETTFIDMSYSLKGKLVPKSESAEERRVHDEAEDGVLLARVEAAIRPNTKLIWAESPTNPMLSLVPIRLIAQVAQAHGIPLVIDNTFSNPFYQNPLKLGASVVVHSGTKYLGGHSDVLSGFIVTSEEYEPKFRFLQNAYGNVPSPFDAWLIIRSLKTLSLRSKQHGLNALRVARWLEEVGVPAGLVRDVRYPGLRRAQETRGQRRERELAWAQMSEQSKVWATQQGYTRDTEGGFPSGGMVSFHIKSPHEASQETSETAERFLEGLELFSLAESLGGVESLAELPLKMTHAGVAESRRAALGIDGELVRLSVGIEEGDDLVADVERSLRAAIVA